MKHACSLCSRLCASALAENGRGSIVDEIDTSEITAIEREKVQLNEAKVRAETVLAEVNEEMTEIDNEKDQVPILTIMHPNTYLMLCGR